MDINKTSCDYVKIYTNTESVCCIPECRMLCINYALIKKLNLQSYFNLMTRQTKKNYFTELKQSLVRCVSSTQKETHRNLQTAFSFTYSEPLLIYLA